MVAYQRVIMLGIVLLWGAGHAAPPATAQESKDDGLNAESRKIATEQMKKILDQVRIIRKEASAGIVPLVPKPVLNFSDVPRGHHFGMLWVWGPEGRPAAIIETYTRDFEKTINAWPGNVLHSLSPSALRGEADFRWDWAPAGSGIVFADVPGEPVPAETAAARLIQMRSLAKRFSARETWKGDTAELRLLPTPVWRYRSDTERIVDGALFSMSHGGTNPEVILILEAVKSNESVAWKFGCARMGHAEMHVKFDDQEVWTVELLETAESSSPYYWINPP